MENIDKIKCVLIDFENNTTTLNEAANEILRLFSVIVRSEHLTCKHENIIMNSATTGYCDECQKSIDFIAG